MLTQSGFCCTLCTYCILSNKTVDDILDKRPNDINGLMDIYGMGAKRCEKYGTDILKLI